MKISLKEPNPLPPLGSSRKNQVAKKEVDLMRTDLNKLKAYIMTKMI